MATKEKLYEIYTNKGLRYISEDIFKNLESKGIIIGCSCGQDTDHSKHTPIDNPYVDKIHPLKYSLRSF